MKKIKQKLSRGAVSALALLALFLLGTASAKSENLELNKSVYPLSEVRYYFTPSSDGELTWQTDGQMVMAYLDECFIFDSNDQPIPCKSYIGYEFLFGMYELSSATFALKANQQYYFYWSQNSGGDMSVSVKFTYSEGSSEPDPGPGENEGLVEMEVPAYNLTAPAGDGYYWVAPEDGILT